MHIAFVNYSDFGGPSGVHIFHLANALSDMGISSTVLVPFSPASVNVFGTPHFDIASFGQAEEELTRTTPDLIHAWTPRESTRWVTERLVNRHQIPYIVHLEDNEESILEGYFKTDSAALKVWRRLRLFFNPKDRPLPHPKRYKKFIANACAATVIVDGLKAFLPLHMPSKTFWPACEETIFSLPQESNMDVREQVGIPRDDIVITYPGNVHQSNVKDVEILYEAILLARDQGIKASLIRIGRDCVKFSADFSAWYSKYIFPLGDLAPKEIPKYLGTSDILIQPGRSTIFNQYRFPSKLPMFLASGRPVVIGNSIMTHHLTDGYDAMILKDASCEEMVRAIEEFARSPERRIAVGTAGREFAQKHFSWLETAKDLSLFYKTVLDTVQDSVK